MWTRAFQQARHIHMPSQARGFQTTPVCYKDRYSAFICSENTRLGDGKKAAKVMASHASILDNETGRLVGCFTSNTKNFPVIDQVQNYAGESKAQAVAPYANQPKLQHTSAMTDTTNRRYLDEHEDQIKDALPNTAPTSTEQPQQSIVDKRLINNIKYEDGQGKI